MPHLHEMSRLIHSAFKPLDGILDRFIFILDLQFHAVKLSFYSETKRERYMKKGRRLEVLNEDGYIDVPVIEQM